MKLVGSRNKMQMREELASSNLALREGRQEKLAVALASANVNLERAYVLNWIPEQGEDIYVVLVSPDEVMTVEVPRHAGRTLIERTSLETYAHTCSKVQRLKTLVALGLIGAAAVRSSR